MTFSEKGNTILASQGAEQMDRDDGMMEALRRQIQPHLMMTLTPPRIAAGHPPPPAAQLNYSLPLPSFMIHVS